MLSSSKITIQNVQNKYTHHTTINISQCLLQNWIFTLFQRQTFHVEDATRTQQYVYRSIFWCHNSCVYPTFCEHFILHEFVFISNETNKHIKHILSMNWLKFLACSEISLKLLSMAVWWVAKKLWNSKRYRLFCRCNEARCVNDAKLYEISRPHPKHSFAMMKQSE